MKTPGHLQVSLADYYVLQGTARLPQIDVFPAQAYAELVPAAFESLHRLNNYLYAPRSPVTKDQLPAVPFYNDVQMFVSNVQEVAFQNGRGVRFITQAAQGPVPVNNQELFYHFEGVTSDGVYFIVAILPVTHTLLAESNEAEAPLPTGGIPYPDLSDANANYSAYLDAIAAMLDAASPEAFTPALGQLDALIQTIRIAP
jgi:hypothetical protein